MINDTIQTRNLDLEKKIRSYITFDISGTKCSFSLCRLIAENNLNLSSNSYQSKEGAQFGKVQSGGNLGKYLTTNKTYLHCAEVNIIRCMTKTKQESY